MGRTRWIGVALVAALGVFCLSGCGGGGDDDDTITSGVVATKFFRFDPDTINVAFNQEAVFTFSNEDSRDHNFTTSVFVDRDNLVSVDVPAGQNKQVRFTVTERPRDGFLRFYCRFHQAQGMNGTIRLLPAT